MIYAHLAGYRNLSSTIQQSIGLNPDELDMLDGTMPYMRFGAEHAWGDHYISAGAFGMIAETFPGRDKSAGSDWRRDIGFDLQYRYAGDPHDVALLFRYVDERADWDASQALGGADNASDSLQSFSATASYLYDKTYGIDLNYRSIQGDADAALYGTSTGKPDSDSVTVQLNYLPFNKNGGFEAWPDFNPKLILQYTAYSKFDGARRNYDGTGRDASDNNTLYFMVWLPF